MALRMAAGYPSVLMLDEDLNKGTDWKGLAQVQAKVPCRIINQHQTWLAILPSGLPSSWTVFVFLRVTVVYYVFPSAGNSRNSPLEYDKKGRWGCCHHQRGLHPSRPSPTF